MKGFGQLELLDEEAFRAMVRTAVQEGSPGDDTSCMAGKRRAFEDKGLSNVLLLVASGLEQATPVKSGLLRGGEDHETQTKSCFRGATLPAVGGRSTKDVEKKKPGKRKRSRRQ